MMNNQNTESSKFNELTIIFLVVAAVFILLSILLIVAYVKLRKKYNFNISQTQAYINATNEQKDRDISTITQNCAQEVAKVQNELAQVKQDCEAQIRQTKEEVNFQKASLEKKKEKEILVDVMMTLNGYAGRLDRLEKHLTEDKIIPRINQLFQDISQKINGMNDFLSRQLDEMNTSLSYSINNSELQQKIDNVRYSLERQIDNMNYSLEESINNTLKNTNFANVEEMLENIESQLTDEDDSDSFAYVLQDMKSSIDSIYFGIDDIKSAVDDAVSAAEGARDAIESKS